MQRIQDESCRADKILLIVDDEEFVLSALSRLFRRDGYTVVSAIGPHQALELLHEHNPQVIISDQLMPDMTGTELCSLVRDTMPTTYRMLLSGYIDQQAAETALHCGAVSLVLSKPWDDVQLRQIVREAFGDAIAEPAAEHTLS